MNFLDDEFDFASDLLKAPFKLAEIARKSENALYGNKWTRLL